jgi:hypothetical protein
VSTATAAHTDGRVHDPERRRRVLLYALLAAAFLGLAAWGVAAYRGHAASEQALAKAAQLQESFRAAGLPTFTREGIARTLGTDGGAVCQTAGKGLTAADLKLRLVNGAAGPGIRPVVAPRRAILGELLVVRTYCPDRLDAFREFLRGLQFRDVIRGGS